MAEKNYKVINGTSYDENTPDEVVKWLETSRERKQRIRLFYGDIETGRDWKEENDIIGHIGQSTGNIKIPLLIKSSRSYGGGAILDNCIVKITTKGSDNKIHTVYQHKNYHLFKDEIRTEKSSIPEYERSVIIDGEIIANFKTRQKAENYILFLKGERNKI